MCCEKNKILIVKLINMTLTENEFTETQHNQGEPGISRVSEGKISMHEMALT